VVRVSAHRVYTEGFLKDKDLDYQARITLGQAVHGASDVGEVLATIEHVTDHKSWAAAWSATAARVEEQARDAGDRVAAGSASLRAATYWACVVDALSATDDRAGLLAAFRSHRACWDAFVDASGGAHVRADVPCEGDRLPGYLLRPDASGTARPTLVITNGSDGALSGLWTFAAAGALERGWNAFVFDGPGQQSMLFERNVPFRPDWEAVLTPVVDALVARPDVEATRLTGYGISQGGYWLPRALAFEHRLVAAVVDPGVVDVSTSWLEPLGRSMTGLLDKGDRAAFNRDMKIATLVPSLRRTLAFRSRPYGREDDWFALFTEVREFRLTDELAGRITTPIMVTDAEGEQFWPGQSRRLADLLGNRAELVEFTAAEGASLHCQPMARSLTDERMFGWLARHVA
jgi:hypothetical protein